MIKYNLSCKDCDTNFDSWFASSKEYEKLKKKKFLNCHHCGSLNVKKSLMAPKLISKSSGHKTENERNKYYKIKEKIKEYQKLIEKVEDVHGGFRICDTKLGNACFTTGTAGFIMASIATTMIATGEYSYPKVQIVEDERSKSYKRKWGHRQGQGSMIDLGLDLGAETGTGTATKHHNNGDDGSETFAEFVA